MKVIKYILVLFGGYILGAIIGYLLVGLLSANTHDKAMEQAMTAFFVCGPMFSVISLIISIIRSRKL